MTNLSPVDIHEHDVCVKMLAAPINPSDINRIEGVYPMRPPLPAIGGYEGVGEVHSVGSSVSSVSVGDWVIPCPPSYGMWQSYVVKEESAWHRITKNVPVEYAATVTVNPLTAIRLLDDFVRLNPGDTIIQNGATSTVGQCIIQLANHRGVCSINIIRDREGSDEAKENLKKLGADRVYTESELKVDDMKCILDLPEPRIGFNCVGGSAATSILKLLGHGGSMITYGGMAKKPVTVSASSLIFKDLSLRGFWLQKWMKSEKARETRHILDQLLLLVRNEKLKYMLEVVPFDEFNAALDRAIGKLGSCCKQVLIF